MQVRHADYNHQFADIKWVRNMVTG
jgi:hypothetical protein